MANTTNLNLVKPAGTDYALVSVINGNMDIIDSKVGAIPANESAQSQITALNNQIGNCSPIGKIIVLTNAITFTANASESFDLASYKDCYLLAIYTNSGTLNVIGSSIVTEYNLNHQTGALTMTKTVAGAWNGSKGDVVLVKPISV